MNDLKIGETVRIISPNESCVCFGQVVAPMGEDKYIVRRLTANAEPQSYGEYVFARENLSPSSLFDTIAFNMRYEICSLCGSRHPNPF